jgi:hypothetical protein
MTDLHQQIVDLEAEIEELSHAAERCRKIMIVGRVAIAAGVLLLAALVIGLVRSEPMALIAAITASLAGIALFGSNRSTLQEIDRAVRAHEAHRAEMIDKMDLRAAQDG